MSVQYPSLDDYYGQTAPDPLYSGSGPGPWAGGYQMQSTTTPSDFTADGYPKATPRPGYQWVKDPITGQYTEQPLATTTTTGNSPGADGGTQPSGYAKDGGTQPSGYAKKTTGGTTAGSYTSGAPYPAFTSSFQFPNVQDAPAFNAPKFAYEDFKAPGPFVKPTAADAAAEPGYQFRLGQGTQTLENSAAARGVLRSGGTLKGLEEYGQNFASNEYQNVYNRAASEYDRMFGNKLDVYKTNYGVGRDVFDRTYQGARDEYAPGFATWNARTNAEQNQALAMFKREWDSYALSAGLDSRERDRQLQVTLTQMGIDAGQVLAILGLRG